MPFGARISLSAGVLVLLLAIGNWISASAIEPSLQRAEVLAGMAAVGLMLVAVLWTKAQPTAPTAVDLPGEQGLFLDEDLQGSVRTELAWGSHLLLTATSAATILVVWDKRVLLRRGLVQAPFGSTFVPGAICERARTQAKLISLVKTELYPGRSEFDSVLPGLPAVMVYPLGELGWVVLGGWSERCFTRSDERWFSGWCERLRTTLENADFLPQTSGLPDGP